jgi:hypothetical protein
MCFHDAYVDGLIVAYLINKRSCRNMKKYTETCPVGRYVNYGPGYYIRAGFD